MLEIKEGSYHAIFNGDGELIKTGNHFNKNELIKIINEANSI